MNRETYHVVFVRPVGSGCWTAERIAKFREGALQYAQEERDRVLEFADGTKHRQSTAIVAVCLPEAVDSEQKSYGALRFGECVEIGGAK